VKAQGLDGGHERHLTSRPAHGMPVGLTQARGVPVHAVGHSVGSLRLIQDRTHDMRWLWLTLAVVAVILIPFFLFESYFTALGERIVRGEVPLAAAVAIIGALLALDVVLPVPSSIVSAAAGVLLGFWSGTLVVWVGMTMSCFVAYLIGARSATLARRIVGEDGLVRAREIATRYGDLAIVLCRPVPVIAEASVIFAGVMHVPPARFLLVCALANLGVAAGYAAIGAYSMSVDSFLLAFIGALALPALAWLIGRIFLPRPDEDGLVE
jgi:uncharacterized membrane protein YdjX (TVP38/TMEM64 family)